MSLRIAAVRRLAQDEKMKVASVRTMRSVRGRSILAELRVQLYKYTYNSGIVVIERESTFLFCAISSVRLIFFRYQKIRDFQK